MKAPTQPVPARGPGDEAPQENAPFLPAAPATSARATSAERLSLRLTVAGLRLAAAPARRLREWAESGRIALHNETAMEWHEGLTGLLETGGEADVCLIDFDGDEDAATGAAERLHERFPELALFALSSQLQPERIVRAMRAGCGEYLRLPLLDAELERALARLCGRRERQETGGGRLLYLVGAKGGVGVSTLASRLGTLLARRTGRRTLLVDLQTRGGDLGLYLGLGTPLYHFQQLAEHPEGLDAKLLQSFLSRHASGLDLIAAPERDGPPAEPAAIARTLAFLRAHYDDVLVDLPREAQEVLRAPGHADDALFLVTVAEVAALRGGARALAWLREAGWPAERVRLVLNRWDRRMAIAEEQIEKALARPIAVKVPNAYQQALRGLPDGEAAQRAPGSEWTRALERWAESLAPPAPADAARRRPGLFRRLARNA